VISDCGKFFYYVYFI